MARFRPEAPAFAGATVLLGLLLAVPASAQVDSPRYARALAAGYKAAFLCSDIFNAGMSEAQVEADDLKRNYPELVPIMAELDVGSSRVDLQACKLEYSIVSPK